MPYPPPDNVGAVTDIECFLVWIPDDPAYIRAAFDAYNQLANTWFWGMDEPHPDREMIRQQWLDAIYLTLEDMEMSKLDILIGHVDELEGLLKAQEVINCCNQNQITFVDPESIPDAGYTYDGPGHPATWGDGETVTDLADYQDILCAMAHRFVDYLATAGEQVDAMIGENTLTLTVLSGILGTLSGLGFVIGFLYTVIQTALGDLIDGHSTDLLKTAGEAIETARADIVCAFISGDEAQLSAAVEDVVSVTAWNLFYAYVQYAEALNAAQTGEWQGETIEVDRRSDCGPCDSEFTATFTWDTDLDTWVAQSRSGWYDEGGGQGSINSHPKQGNPPDPTYCSLNRPNLALKAGTSDAAFKLDYIRVTLHAGEDAPNFFSLGKEAYCRVQYDDLTTDVTEFSGPQTDAELTIDTDKEIRSSSGGGTWLWLGGISNGSASNGTVHFDSVEIGFRSA